MERDDICKHAAEPDIDGTRKCYNTNSLVHFNKFCTGVHACKDGEVKE